MLNKLNLQEAREGLRLKKFTSRELVQACLDQITKLDDDIHAFLYINSNALEEADKANINLPLGGLPIAVKDNFLTMGMPTTAASKLLDGYMPMYDATVVKKLKEAGAIIIGKTNMDAWAHGSSTETSDFGPTKNPHDLTKLPGGSSGGSAAAVASDMCIAAIGSETAGSIRQPASWCGVTGFKPTYGSVSRYGVIAMASSTDSPGPITKNAEDAKIIYDVIKGQDKYDATTIGSWKLEAGNWKKLRIGLAKEYMLKEMRDDVKKLILDAAERLRGLGHEVIEISLLDPKYSIGVYTIVQRAEVSSNLARFDGIRYGKDRSNFGSEAKRRIMLGTYVLSSGYYDQYYNKAQKVRNLIIKDFESAFSKVDLIIGPTSPGAALPIGASLDQPMFGEMEDSLAEPSSIAGLTGISVPCGKIDNLPIGLQFIGPQKADDLVLFAAQEFQNI